MHAPTVIIPSLYLGWLDISDNALVAALADRGIKAILIPSPVVSASADGRRHPLLDDAARYMLAIQNESCTLGDIPDLPGQAAVVHARLAAMYDHYLSYLAATPTDLVLLIQGIEPNNAALRAAAIDLGRPLLALENTSWQRRMIWENISGTPTIQNLARNHYFRFKGNFPEAVLRQFAEDYFSDIREQKSPEHRSPAHALPAPSEKPTVLFLAQVLTDSSLIFGVNTWRSPLDLMLETASWCAESGYRLVIKLHPKECSGADPIFNRPYDRLTFRKMGESPHLRMALAACDAIVDSDNVYDTLALIATASVVVTMNSQAGLEAAMLNKPVITGRNAFYSDLGFTLDGCDPAALRASLLRAQSWRPSSSPLEFGYVFFQHYCAERSVHGAADLIVRQLGGQGSCTR